VAPASICGVRSSPTCATARWSGWPIRWSRGLRGGGLYFAVASGAIAADELHALVPVERTFRPDAGNREVYDRLFAEFAGLHSRNKKMFVRLNGTRERTG
jgi:flavin-dependent dehydrogenase